MSMVNIKYSKIRTIQGLLQETADQRNTLLSEMIVSATDSVIFERRIRMLSQLADLESQLLKKIMQFETQDPSDLDMGALISEVRTVINRSS